jgi:hypothetical protein
MLTYQSVEENIQENYQFLLDSFNQQQEKTHIEYVLNNTEIKIIKSHEDEKDNLKKLKLEKFKLTLSKPIAWLKGQQTQYQDKEKKLLNNIRAIEDQGVDSVADINHIYLSVSQLNDYAKNEFNHMSHKEMMDFIYFHELGHLLQHANVKIDSFYHNMDEVMKTILNQKKDNDQIKSTQMFILPNDNSEKLKYNIVSTFLLEHVLNYSKEDNKSANFTSTAKNILKSCIDECFADTYAILCQAKKDGNLDKHIKNTMITRSKNLEAPENMLHFTYYGVSQIKDILKEKNITLNNLTLENIQEVAKEVANITLHKNLYTFIKRFDTVKYDMQNTLFEIVNKNDHIQFDLILGKDFKEKDKYQLFETYEKFVMKKIGFPWAIALKQEIQNDIANKVIKLPMVKAEYPTQEMALKIRT